MFEQFILRRNVMRKWARPFLSLSPAGVILYWVECCKEVLLFWHGKVITFKMYPSLSLVVGPQKKRNGGGGRLDTDLRLEVSWKAENRGVDSPPPVAGSHPWRGLVDENSRGVRCKILEASVSRP